MRNGIFTKESLASGPDALCLHRQYVHRQYAFLEYLDILYTKHNYVSICMLPAHIPDGKFPQSRVIIIEKIGQLGA